MNSEIIALAFGAKCGGRGRRLGGGFSPGLLGPSAASNPSRSSRCASANRPTPAAVFDKMPRRVGGQLIDIKELVRGQQLLAEVRERGQGRVDALLTAEGGRLIFEEGRRQVQFLGGRRTEIRQLPGLGNGLVRGGVGLGFALHALREVSGLL